MWGSEIEPCGCWPTCVHNRRFKRLDIGPDVGGLCNSENVRARDDDGVELNAEFTVEADEPYLSLVLESAGGRTVRSGRPRNDQYVPALRLLLRRLGDRRAVLVSALVASARTSALAERERSLLQGPLDLGSISDFEQLRMDITRAQGHVGLPPDATKEGNNRKRLQLRFDVPRYGPGDADKLAADLAWPPIRELQVWPTARELLRSLIGEEISTVAGNPNMVLAVHGDTALVRTTRSPEGQPVEVGAVQKGLDMLRMHGSVRVSIEKLGHRSAFVGAVLATLPGAQFARNPATVTFSAPGSSQVGTDPAFGVLDSVASVKVRKEQAQLRYGVRVSLRDEDPYRAATARRYAPRWRDPSLPAGSTRLPHWAGGRHLRLARVPPRLIRPIMSAQVIELQVPTMHAYV